MVKKPKSKDAVFSAKDVAELVGLTYRQLNDWEAKGFAFQRSCDSDWRRFNAGDLFAFLILMKLRKTLGTPVKSLSWLYSKLTDRELNFLQKAINMLNEGKSPLFLFTDLESTAFLETPSLFSKLFTDHTPANESSDCMAMVKIDNLLKDLFREIDPTNHIMDEWRNTYGIDPKSRANG